MAILKAGDSAPLFTLPTDGGCQISLSELSGRKVLLYFYPKDDTSGCTKQAIDLTRLRDAFEKANTVIIGVSADSVASHDKFKKKHDLGFTLGSDEKREMLEAYGVWVQKSMYGRKYMGIERTTLLIDTDGKVARVWPKVSVTGHAEEVLKAAQAI
jgi:peroxiredoxin Q/BCP